MFQENCQGARGKERKGNMSKVKKQREIRKRKVEQKLKKYCRIQSETPEERLHQFVHGNQFTFAQGNGCC